MFTVQVDTGSSGLAVPAKGCTQRSMNQDLHIPCTSVDDFYDISRSSSGRQLGCNEFTCDACNNGLCSFSILYGDGSFVFGTVTRDTIILGGLQGTVEFGSINGQSKGFQNSGVDGIMGMAYQSLDVGLGSVFGSFFFLPFQFF